MTLTSWFWGSSLTFNLDQISPGRSEALLRAFLHRFADRTQDLLYCLLPPYRADLRRARTSCRPIEIAGRRSSYRKDDTRLHVDAVPSRPTGGARILRLFCNVNPYGQPRAWRLGERFVDYARRFLPLIQPPFPGSATFLRIFHLPKGYRTLYDHYMLQLHDLGKADLSYQRQSPQMTFDFPPGSTWIAFTDQAIPAAHGGQYPLEQTFHLRVKAQGDPEQSSLRVLEKLTGRSLRTGA